MSKKTKLLLPIIVLLICSLTACTNSEPSAELVEDIPEPIGHMELQYADQFEIDYLPDDYTLITLANGERFLLIPEGKKAPEWIGPSVEPIYQPVDNIYLAATAAMRLFDGLDALDAIKLSGTRADNWYVPNAVKEMEDGNILFAGKYSEPDYELIKSCNCKLAIESTMIDHSPDIKEKLETLGVTVFTDLSSRENHPLGRTEWVKVYGTLLGKTELANEEFDKQVQCLEKVANCENTGKTVAFFRVSLSDMVYARKSGDYVTRMIELAGGNYIFENLGDPQKRNATVPVEMEEFYSTARQADVIIYNSTIGSQLQTLDDLLELNTNLKDFKAVQNGNVWCTGENMFQETLNTGEMIEEMHTIFTNEDSELTELKYFYKLK